MQVLLIEDDSVVAQSIQRVLAIEKFNVTVTELGEEGTDFAARSNYDIILLDLQLPDVTGIEVLRSLRAADVGTPVLMLSGNAGQEAKVTALRFGADDYVTKPFHMRELTARVRAAIRRAQTKDAPPENVLQIGAITLDPGRRVVSKAGQPVHLTPKEFDLLHYLMLNAGKPIAHGRLLTAVWGPDYGGELEYLRTFVRQLRKKLEDDPSHPAYLMTEMWFGYRFQAEP